MKKICVCGHFAFGKEMLDGQTVKTKVLTAVLEKEFGANEVAKIDTHGAMKAMLKLPFKLFSAMRRCRNIVILPAHNGIRVVTPILSFYKHFLKRKLHYAVIGGWLPAFLQNKKRLTKKLKRFDGIYVETTTMQSALLDMGFQNIVVMPNFKELAVLSEGDLTIPEQEPYKLCTFSRVMKEKGMEDAIAAIRAINEQKGRVVYELDIYGPVDPSQTEWFDALQGTFPSYVRYGGSVPFDKSVETLKDYFALLFPTRFYTEGVPGTVIDAYAAGLPVISAKWQSYGDIVEDGVTGCGYEFGDVDALTRLLAQIAEQPDAFLQMKPGCLRAAERYLPKNAIRALTDRMD